MDSSASSTLAGSGITKNEHQSYQNENIKLDNDCEHIYSLMREEDNPLNYQQVVNLFLERNRQFCTHLIRQMEFKNSFFVYRKVEKVMLPLLKKFEQYDDPNFPIKNINNELAQQISNIDSAKVIKVPSDLIVKKLPQRYLSAYEFSSNILSSLVSCVNNQGTIYMLRGKADVALNCFSKAAESRIKYINSHQHQYQAAIIFLNIAFCLKNKENYEESSKMLNKSILIIESIEKVSKEFAESDNLVESSSFMLCLLEMLYNKNEKDFRDEEITQRQKLFYLLSISYNYYGELLSKLQKPKEAEFCKKQSEVLFKQFRKKGSSLSSTVNSSMTQFNRPSSSSSTHSTAQLTSQNIQQKFPDNQGYNQYNQDESKIEDNFSHASFQTVNTTQSYAAFGGQNISKDNIIFQKYIKLTETRYKIIILQIKEYSCVQIILYNKPNNFLSKIIVGFQQLIDYSQKIKMSNAFFDQDQLNDFFKELSRRLQIEKGQLKIRDLEYYNSIEEYTKFSKVLPSNLTNLK